MLKSSEIHIRDPFIVPVPEEGKYYLYGTTDYYFWGGRGIGFDTFISGNLNEWDGPFPVFRREPGFWGDRNFWAAEVHRYGNRYYMFASFKAEGVCRATQIFVSDSPKGAFRLHSDGPVTPGGWESIDGTLFVDEIGDPWMLFIHEWVQIHDGEVCAIRLTSDLTKPVGEPILFFHGSDAPWVKRGPDQKDFVTDGPFLYRAENGTLLMLWSSFGEEGYAIGIARSTSGKVTGPWVHDTEPLYSKDGGHGMLFRTFDGSLMLTFHSPNKTPEERLVILPIQDNNSCLVISGLSDPLSL